MFFGALAVLSAFLKGITNKSDTKTKNIKNLTIDFISTWSGHILEPEHQTKLFPNKNKLPYFVSICSVLGIQTVQTWRLL